MEEFIWKKPASLAGLTESIDHTNSSVFTLVLALPFTALKSIIVWPDAVVMPVGWVKASIVGATFFNDMFGKIIVSE